MAEEIKETEIEEKPVEDLTKMESEMGVNNEEITDSAEEIVTEEEIESIKELEKKEVKESGIDVESWKPKTEIGKKVKSGEITDIDQILDKGGVIKETEIVDILIPGLDVDLLLVGQSKGKFGGGKRRVFKQTQKKTKEGNKPKFSTYAIVGDGKGHIGLGVGKSKETVPAREKAIRNAKLNLIKILRACGSWECACGTGHSIPFAVEGKCGSIRIKINPAPKGTGLKAQSECAKMLKIAGIKDVWSKALGQTKSRSNLLQASFNALKTLITTKLKYEDYERLGIKTSSEKTEEGKTQEK